jgi:hypothetical protein
MYLNHQFPFGEKIADLGLCVNTFMFETDAKERGSVFAKTDFGPARAYRVTYRNGKETEECIALSHESGLEVFPAMVATSPGKRPGRHPLSKSIDRIEANINWWWERYKADYWGPSKVLSFLPLVEGIDIRTPFWEFPLDDSFIPKDRELILEHITSGIQPAETIAEFIAALPNKYLKEKIIGSGKRIVEAM